jgi:hypothetical protein
MAVERVGNTTVNNICIVCPHTRNEHVSRYEQAWCTPCNTTEIAGPCSFYFIGRHRFEPNRVERLDEYSPCRICKLMKSNDAHKYLNGMLI